MRRGLGLVALIVAAVWMPVAGATAQTGSLPPGIPAGSVAVTATGAEDGEKLLVEAAGKDQVVRFLGADAPEPDNGGNPECYFKESRDRLSKMLKGRTVYLERESSDKDGKDRLLRYVWFVGKSDGKAYLAQEQMLREGFLIFKAEEKDDRYEERLRDAQKDAKADDAGLWGECGGGHVAIADVPERGQDEDRPATNRDDGGDVAVPTIASGGLGLSQREWEAEHGEGEGNGLLSYEDGTFLVLYWSDDIWNLTWYLPQPVSLGDAGFLSTTLIPDDAVFVESSRAPSGKPMDVYTSASLADRYDPSDGFDPWGDAPPGTFIVLYNLEDNGTVTSILIAAGNNP